MPGGVSFAPWPFRIFLLEMPVLGFRLDFTQLFVFFLFICGIVGVLCIFCK